MTPTGNGILETILVKLTTLERTIEPLGDGHSPIPTGLELLSDRERLWSAGAITIREAVNFSGIGRSELYRLMGTGELPFTNPTTRRLIPRLWLVRYLAQGRSNTTSGTLEEIPVAKNGKPKK